MPNLNVGFLLLATGLIGPSYGNSAICDVCLMLGQCISGSCYGRDCSSLDTQYMLLEECASQYPYGIDPTLTQEFVSEYGNLFVSFSPATDPLDLICTSIGVCQDLKLCTPANCKGDTDWASAGTGYETRTNKYCAGEYTCTTEILYRCAAGYWGIASGASGCTKCPENASSSAGVTKQTSCYHPSGTTFSDSTGSGVYTGNCYFSE